MFALLVTRKVRKAHPAAIVRMAQIQRKQILNHYAVPSAAFRIPRHAVRGSLLFRESRLAPTRAFL